MEDSPQVDMVEFPALETMETKARQSLGEWAIGDHPAQAPRGWNRGVQR